MVKSIIKDPTKAKEEKINRQLRESLVSLNKANNIILNKINRRDFRRVKDKEKINSIRGNLNNARNSLSSLIEDLEDNSPY